MCEKNKTKKTSPTALSPDQLEESLILKNKIYLITYIIFTAWPSTEALITLINKTVCVAILL